MLNDIPESIRLRMRALEAIDARDRLDGTPREQRLRQVPPETGRFLAFLARCAPAGAWLEIGTSAGYSTLWLALAAAEAGARIRTFELLEFKQALARETFARAGVESLVELVPGDALAHLTTVEAVGFCFLDTEKPLYGPCYESLVPKLVPGGILVADNAINHAAELAPMLARAQADARVDALVVPVGKGLLLCRRKD
ncbi:MAG: class I SAM-dependent methyltransferase [Caldilineae bacterium]|nr:class I SAM-dependent methyltransferase [Chloroflexota bacterium]MCB9175716.1 class I SAM-dependent methyltransferase [Caldilineae bacterium]